MDRGLLYMASGQKYIDEAIVSARSAKKIMPDLPICIVADREVSDPVFDVVIVNPDAKGDQRDKLRMDLTPFDRTIFLDTDTYIIGDIQDIFTLLDRFDFAAHQPSTGYANSDPEVPHSFPGFNAGVLAFRKNEKIMKLLRVWQDAYEREPLFNGRKWDQRPLRKAVYQSDVRFAVLTPEYNLMPWAPMGLGRAVKVLHGRPIEHLLWMEKHVNQYSKIRRGFLPEIGVLPVHNRTRFGMKLRLMWKVPSVLFSHICWRLQDRLRIWLRLRFGVKSAPPMVSEPE